MMRSCLVLCLVTTFSAACEHHEDAGEGVPPSSTEIAASELAILAVGDSALAWNGAQSIPRQLQAVLKERGVDALVVNASVSGATLSCGEDGLGTPDNCIPPQLQNGPWDYVLLSGGANDIMESGCTPADAFINASLNGGKTVEFIEQIKGQGAHVLLYGYFDPATKESEFATCQPIRDLLDRYKSLGDLDDSVTFIDAGDVVTPAQPSFYADDVHPSPKGSAVIAAYIADNL